MDADELLRRITSEPERAIVRTVHALPAEAGGLRLTELAALKRPGEVRTFRHRHIVGPAVSPSDLAAWQSRWPAYPLPTDLAALLLKVNGIHLWANVETGRAYTGLAPLEEWAPARELGVVVDERYLGLSYHADGATVVALDVRSGTYYLMDTAGADTSSPLGASVGDLLDWLWRTRMDPKD